MSTTGDFVAGALIIWIAGRRFIRNLAGSVERALIQNGQRARAFTLLELLTVVAIIAVIAGMSMPVLSRGRAQAEDVKCSSNLRQIGLGILAYAGDNENQLPGPLKLGIFPYWLDNTTLAWILRDYLDVDENRRKKRLDVFVCPATFRITHNTSDAPHYLVNVFVPMRDSTVLHQPFGYPFEKIAGNNNKTPAAEFSPMRLEQLSDICDENGAPAAASTWAMKDADRLLPVFRGWSYERLLPEQKVHSTHRNALFFDFHVGKVDQE